MGIRKLFHIITTVFLAALVSGRLQASNPNAMMRRIKEQTGIERQMAQSIWTPKTSTAWVNVPESASIGTAMLRVQPGLHELTLPLMGMQHALEQMWNSVSTLQRKHGSIVMQLSEKKWNFKHRQEASDDYATGVIWVSKGMEEKGPSQVVTFLNRVLWHEWTLRFSDSAVGGPFIELTARKLFPGEKRLLFTRESYNADENILMGNTTLTPSTEASYVRTADGTIIIDGENWAVPTGQLKFGSE